MRYISTRDNWEASDSGTVIRLGMVPDGGLFVPETYPEIFDQSLMRIETYIDCANAILEKYLTDYDRADISAIIGESYGDNFNSKEIAPLHKLDNNTGILELWHGPTAAFKDMALQCMPRLLVQAIHSFDASVQVMILVATSGDTGKAALDGFKNIKGTRIVVFYPSEGVSMIQKQQMVTQDGENTKVVGVNGNFDDCQTAVKNVFRDRDLREKAGQKGIIFSSANSINWGRLVTQIVYYFWAYNRMHKQKMIEWGDPVLVCVPTGNFGNILAAYYASRMGLPVRKFICASNMNNILTDFINTGEYNIKRKFHTTASPSMDILISSNLERLIFELMERDGKKVNALYDDLKSRNAFCLGQDALKKMQALFYGGFATEEETSGSIAEVFDEKGYVLDTHTAVGYHVLKKYRQAANDETKAILTSTAHPYKFPQAVYHAITGKKGKSDFETLQLLHDATGMDIHPSLSGIESRKVTNKDVINTDEIESYVEGLL